MNAIASKTAIICALGCLGDRYPALRNLRAAVANGPTIPQIEDIPPPMEFVLHAHDVDTDTRALALKEKQDGRTYQKTNWKGKRREKRRAR